MARIDRLLEEIVRIRQSGQVTPHLASRFADLAEEVESRGDRIQAQNIARVVNDAFVNPNKSSVAGRLVDTFVRQQLAKRASGSASTMPVGRTGATVPVSPVTGLPSVMQLQAPVASIGGFIRNIAGAAIDLLPGGNLAQAGLALAGNLLGGGGGGAAPAVQAPGIAGGTSDLGDLLAQLGPLSPGMGAPQSGPVPTGTDLMVPGGGAFTMPVTMRPVESKIFRVARQYALLTLSPSHPAYGAALATGNSVSDGKGNIKIGLLKHRARSSKLWKPRAKPLLTAAEGRTIKEAAKDQKKVRDVAAKYGIQVTAKDIRDAKK